MQEVEGGNDVMALASAVVEGALGSLHPPEVEAQGGDAVLRQGREQGADDDRPHAAAVLRVRVGEHRRAPRLVRYGQLAFERESVGRLQLHAFETHSRGRYFRVVVDEDSKQPIKMQSDRLLVQIPGSDGERKSRGGILIPATAQLSKRLVWAEAVAVGPHVRNIEPGDSVLFNPEDRYEVEVRGEEYLILRERDIHAVASERIEGGTGLYL